MQPPCLGGKESLTVQALPDGFRHNESSTDWRTSCAFSDAAAFVQIKAGVLGCPDHWMHLHPSEEHVLTWACEQAMNTVCRCSSFSFTLAWVLQYTLPHPDIPHANKIPLSGADWTVPSDYCCSGAGQFPLRSNAEFSCRCFSPIKTSRSVCFLHGGRGCEKIEEPHSIAQASWAISNSEGKEIMNQIIGNGNRATKMTS